MSAVLAGYGYQPYRLLGWMLVQLAACSAILLLLPRPRGSTQDAASIVFTALQDFVNPMGFGDTAGLSHWAFGVLVVESYLGTISIAVFFVLMVRRWFRV